MLNRTINELYIGRPNPKKGDVGLEIEVEGTNLPRENQVAGNWNVVHEGSIGGRDMAYEYVLKGPQTIAKSMVALGELNRAYQDNESVVQDSYRAGTHVHINCQHLTLMQAYNYVSLALCLEPLILKDCGEERVGNLFCLQAVDAEGYVDRLARAFQSGDGFRELDPNNVKYSAVNAAPMTRFGTLEFRCMKSTSNPAVLVPFMKKLLKMRDFACNLRNPSEIMNLYSVMGPKAFVAEVFGGDEEVSDEDVESLWQSVRVVQDLVYCREW